MERLTTPGGECISMVEPCLPDENCARACLLMHLDMVSDRLAAYEETGLTPEQIKQLAADRRISLADEATAEYLDYLALGTIDDLTALVKARDEGRVVVHGRWIEDEDTQTCSNCGEEHEWGDYRASYCDTCGAKMDAPAAGGDT